MSWLKKAVALGEAEAANAVPALRGAKIGAVLIATLAAIGAIGFAFWWIFIHPHQLKQQAAQAKADSAIATGAQHAAQDAMKITLDVRQHAASIDVTTQRNRDAILSAPGAAAPIDAGLAAAVHAALCVRDAYRAEPDCAGLRGAGGGVGAAQSDAGGGAAGGADGGR